VHEPNTMEDRILDIVVYMLSQMRERSGGLDMLGQFAPDLESQGFSSNEINEAYSWVFDRFGAEVGVRDKSDTSPFVRVLAPHERLAVESEAYGYLLRLCALGILGRGEFEQVIDHCVQTGRVGADVGEIKEIVSDLLFTDDSSYSGAWYEGPADGDPDRAN